MKVNNVKETKVTSLADRYSVGHKAISVALSVVLLGFGWPAVSPSEVYAESAEAQASAAENAQAKTEDAPANSDATGASNNDASLTKVQATTSDSQAGSSAASTTTADNSSQTQATSSAAATQSQPSAAAATSGAEQPSSYDIALQLSNASLKTVTANAADAQVVNPPASKLTVPTGKDFKFTVTAAAGYKLDKAALTSAGVERELTADANGTYTIAASDLTTGMTLTLATSEDVTTSDNATSDAVSIENIDDGAAVQANEGPSISGPTEVVLGTDNIKFTWNGNDAIEWDVYNIDGGNTLELDKSDAHSATYKAKTGWLFNGESIRVQIKVQYQDPNNQYNRLTSNPITVTVKKRTYSLIYAPVVKDDENHYVMPKIVDSLTGAILDTSAETFNCEFYKDGKWIGNRYNHGSSDFYGPGEYTIKVKPADGWYYYGEEQTIVIPNHEATAKEINADSPSDHIYDGDEHKWQPTVTDTDGNAVPENGYDVVYKRNGEVTTDFTSTGIITVTITGKGNYSGTIERSYCIYGIQGKDQIKVGEKTTYTGSGFTSDVTWSSSDSGILSIDPATGEATGVYPGTVTIYAVDNDGHSCSKDVTVVEDSSKGAWVYVYTEVFYNGVNLSKADAQAQAKRKELGLTVNGHGYFTLGKLWVSDIQQAKGTTKNNFNDATIAEYMTKAVASVSRTERYSVANGSINLSDITWTKMVDSNQGADNYSKAGNAWHLDGKIEINSTSKVTVRHVELGSKAELANPTFVTAKVGSTFDPKNEIISIKGYNYAQADSAIVVDDSGNQEVYIYYTKGSYPYTIKYVDADTKEDLHEPNTGHGEYGDTVAVNALNFAGYNVDQAEKSLKIGEGENTVIFYYSKKTVNYTIKYVWCGNEITDQVQGALKSGESVTAEPKTINGYTIVPDQNLTKTALDGAIEITVNYYKNVVLTANSNESTSNVYDGKTTYECSGFTAKSEIDSSVITDADFGDGVSAYRSEKNAGTYMVELKGVTVGQTKSADDKYLVTEANPGELKVWPNDKETTITITGKSDELTYDGNEHIVSGYSIFASNDAFIESDKGDIAFNGAAFVKGTDVNVNATGSVTSYKMGLSQTQFSYTGKNFSNVKFVVVDGYLKIKPKSVTLTSASNSKEYDGTALTDESVTSEGFLDGQGAKYSVTGSQTVPGDSENTFTYTLDENTQAKNYVINQVMGKLTVTERVNKYDITVVANSNNVPMYTGGEYTAEGFETTTFTFDNGATFTVQGLATSNPKAKNAGSYDNVISGTPKVVDVEGNDVTSQFEVATENGQLTIGKRNITLTSATDSKQYDGTPLTNHKVTVSGDGFIGTDTPSSADYMFDSASSVTNFGDKAENKFTLSADRAKYFEKNYTITYAYGTLKITQSEAPVIVTVRMNSDNTPVYDGGEHSVSGYTVESVTANGKDISSTYDSANSIRFNGAQLSKTDAGTYTYEASAGDFENINAAYKNVEFVVISGQLTIAKRDVTMKSAGNEKVYDGTPLTNNNVTAEGFVGGQGATYNVTGSQTNVGSSDNMFTYTLNAGTNANNYNIKDPVYGTLTVTAQPNIVAEDPDNVVYNGKNQYREPVVKSGNTVLVKDRDYTLSYSDDVKNVGEVTVTVTGKGNYAGKDTAAYQITKRPVILASSDDSKTYDGVALANENAFAIGQYDFVAGDVENVRATGSIVNAGSTVNTIAYDVKISDELFKRNYAVEEHPGTLTVNPKDVADDATMTIGQLNDVVYNGNPQAYRPFVRDNGKLLIDGTDYDVAFSDDVVNAGTVTVTITGKGNYTGATTVEYKILPREVELWSFDHEWTYDGNEHSDFEVLVRSYYNFVDGEVSDLKANGKITEPGSVTNSIAFTKNANYKDGNYKLTVHEGTLTVKAKDLNAAGMQVGALVDVPYNGQTQEQYPTVTDGEKTLVAGTDYDVAFSGDTKNVTDAGVTVTITGKGNYTGKVERTYRITPKALTVVTKSDSRAYNGQDLTADGSIDGFVEGESADFKVTGKQNAVGSSINTYEINWNGVSAKQGNYSINEQLGTLTVTENNQEIVVTTTGGSYTYDGLTHEPVVTVGNLPEGYTVQSAVSNTTAKDVNTDADGKGGVSVTADTVVILNAAGEDVTSKLNITKVDGMLSVTPARVVVNTPSASKVYDGSALTAEGSISGLVEGETVDFKTTGSQTEQGKSDNTYELNWTGSAKESNYTVEWSVGTLEVTKQSITPGSGETPDPNYKGITIGDPSDVKYDGAEHKWAPVVKDAAGNELTAGTDYTVSYDTDNFKDAKTITVTIEGAGNYTGKVTKTYSITKRTVTLVSQDGSWPYDGTAHTKQAVDVATGDGQDGFVAGEGVTYKDFVSVTDYTAQPVDNAFGYDAKQGTNLDNYEISQQFGELNITKAPAEGNIALATSDASRTYDGTPLTAAKATATVGFGNTAKVEYSLDGQAWTESLDEITATNVLDSVTVQVRASSEANYDGYVYATEQLTITPACVIITTPSKDKVYDGTPLKAEGSIAGIVDGETYTFATTGSQTAKGESANTYSLKWDGSAKESNYSIEQSIGKLKVTERSIGDVAYGMAVDAPADVEYDGAAHQWVPTVTDNGKKLVEGIDYTVSYDKADFTNVTGNINVAITGMGNYKGSVVKSYQITPAPLAITTDGAEKVYDGTALTHDVAAIAGLKNSETATIHATGSQTAVGHSSNTYAIAWDGTAVESNYKVVSEVLGVLNVKQSEDEIVATPQDVTATYDGQAHGTTVQVTGVPAGYTVKSASSNATATNVADGSVAANVDDLVIVNAQGEDVTDQLNITRNTGTITINPAQLSVVTGGATKQYDGTALTNEAVEVSGFANGETAIAKATGSIVEVGKQANGYTIAWGDVDSRNYSIAENLGTLEVTPSNAAVAITSGSASKTYDGTLLTSDEATATGLPAGFSVKIATSASQTDFGTAANTIDSYQIFNAEGKDVTAMFANVSTTTGTLNVDKKDVTVSTEGATKVYDGTALTNGNGSIDGLEHGETATVKPSGTQTEVGSSSNGYDIAWGTAKADNYNVASDALGTLTVTGQSIVPGTGDQPNPAYKGVKIDDPSNATYDGAEHKWTPTVTDANGNALAEGTDYTVSYDKTDFTDTGTITVTITGAGNYTGTVVKTYVIGKAPVTVATNSADKVYDGTALTAGGTIAGIVDGETVDFAATGSQTAVGSSENTYRLAWTGTAKESNYAVTSVETGTLTVKENESDVVVTTVGGTFTYDGQAHGATVTVSALPAGYTLESAASAASATDVNGDGIAATADNLVIRNAEGQDVTANLNIVRKDGTIKVTPAQLAVATDSASRVFDGSALTAGGSIEGFVNGEEASFAATGTQTAVGSSQNGYSLSFDKTAKEGNYVIASETLGTLTVSAQSITPGGGDQPDDAYKGVAVDDPTDVVYDNAEHKWAPMVTDADGNALTEGIDYEVAYNTDDFVNVGEIAATITGIGNYKGSVVKTYRITPAELTVTTGSATKTYDGTALTNSELRIDGLKGADAVAARTTGEQTEVGSSENTYAIDWRKVNPNNYTVSEQLGTLTVEAAPVVPNPGDNGNGGTTPGGTTDNGTTPGGTPATNNGGNASTPANGAPAGPIEAIAQILESGYETVTGDMSASAPEEQIYDEENPLGKAESETCWVHWYMMLGMLLTALYGVLVWLRRGNHTNKLKNDMNDILRGDDDKDSKESPVATGNPATEA